MQTRKAVRIHRFGGPEELRIEDLPIPEPQDDEVVIAVHAASVNPVDYKIRQGKYPEVKAADLPAELGRDASGTVAILGTRAHTLKVGDPIYAFLPTERGAYTDYLLVKAVEMAARPQRIDHVQAAAVPLAGLTAWQALHEHGGLKSGERVLIHGGAGGVGHFAVQFAKAAGAHVLTTVGPDDLGFARELGADEAIDYKGQRFEDVARDIDLVIDLIAGEIQERSFAVLRHGGRMVSTLTEPSQSLARTHGVTAARFTARPSGEQLNEIAALIDAGKVTPHVAAVMPFADVQEAHRRMEKGGMRGKLVLQLAAER
jgi:NADPH:quinone reductase-like Zn-dependent oxidoreductase